MTRTLERLVAKDFIERQPSSTVDASFASRDHQWRHAHARRVKSTQQ